MKSLRIVFALLALLALVFAACGDDDDPVDPINGLPTAHTETISSHKDNTLYQEDGLCPACPGTNGVLDSLSNGAGEYVFIGTNNVTSARRALIAFDIAGNLPSNATVDSVVLTLNMSRSISDSVSSSLHRVLAEWGEGTSDASCCLPEEGSGGTATVGDATWAFRLFRSSAWTTPGGDFVATASATQGIDAIGLYTWQSAEMTADVQGWLDSPATNFGWILLGDESTDRTAKRFDAHETAATGPRLTIHYTVP